MTEVTDIKGNYSKWVTGWYTDKIYLEKNYLSSPSPHLTHSHTISSIITPPKSQSKPSHTRQEFAFFAVYSTPFSRINAFCTQQHVAARSKSERERNPHAEAFGIIQIRLVPTTAAALSHWNFLLYYAFVNLHFIFIFVQCTMYTYAYFSCIHYDLNKKQSACKSLHIAQIYCQCFVLCKWES